MITYSVITAVYNGAASIGRLAASVLEQRYPHVEWIVQDGGSTDGTLDRLRGCAGDARVRIASAPDSGVYDAWNRALERATGDWAIFLGADDAFASPQALVQCHRHLRLLPPEVELAFGALMLGSKGQADTLLNRTLASAYHAFLSDIGIPFPATFIRLPLLRRERFDPGFRIAGDFDFAARAVNGENLARIPVIVSYMEKGGISQQKGNCTLLEERLRVLFHRVAPKARLFMEASANHLMEASARLEPLAS